MLNYANPDFSNVPTLVLWRYVKLQYVLPLIPFHWYKLKQRNFHIGVAAKKIIEHARSQLAEMIHADTADGMYLFTGIF